MTARLAQELVFSFADGATVSGSQFVGGGGAFGTIIVPSGSNLIGKTLQFVATSPDALYADTDLLGTPKTLAAGSGEANGIETAPKSVVFSSVATSTGAGTARFLMLGDSMTANGSMQSRLNSLAVGDVTSIVNMGTVGTDPVRNEGYSGQQNGIFFSPGNPFYNPATQDFDFNYYMTNLGVANPTHVLLASGFWHVASATSDAEVIVNAGSLIAQFERMITSIRARSTAIKVGIWTNPVQPYDGQDGESQQITPLSSARRRRNAILLGAQMINTFSGREAGGVFSVCCGQTMNPQTGYARSELVPVDATVAARISATTYANYAALIADLAPADGAISLVGGTRYYVKVWGSGVGHWRPVEESDGFARRVTDSIHPSAGYNAMGNLVWAWIKATM